MIVGTQVMEFGLVCWNIVFIIVLLNVEKANPMRVGNQFVDLEKKSHRMAIRTETMVMGIRSNESGEN